MNYDIEINKFGTKRYYLNNKLHREDGPAVECADETKFWFLNGLLHREDEPAIEYANGDKIWCKNGQRHRDDGPAIEFTSGAKEWYLYDKCHGYNNDFTNKSWIRFVKTLILY